MTLPQQLGLMCTGMAAEHCVLINIVCVIRIAGHMIFGNEHFVEILQQSTVRSAEKFAVESVGVAQRQL